MNGGEPSQIDGSDEIVLGDGKLNTGNVNVEAALQQLEELAYQTMKESGAMDEEQLKEFLILSENISELAIERQALQDELEIETIAGSKKRHALQILPGRYTKEMEDAVLAARMGNHSEMTSLQRRLKLATEKTEKSDKTYETLTKENVKLQPECNRIRKEHDQIIAQLNQRMSDKANKKISLNESRDAYRDLKQQTSEIDVGLENLAEDLENEKQEAAATKEDLLSQAGETDVAIKVQKEKNVEEKRVTDKILDKTMEMSVKIDDEQKIVRRLENSHARLEMQALKLSNKIDREKLANKKLFNEKEVLEGIKNKQEKEYQGKIEELEKKLKVVQDQIIEAREENKKISKEKDVMFNKTEEAGRMKNRNSSKVKEASLVLESIRKKTTAFVERSAELAQSNAYYREQIIVLEENHKATVDTYNSQIDDYNENLNQERQEKVKVQEMRDVSEKVLETFRTEQLMFMNEMSKSIEDAQIEHQKLTDKGLFLVRDTDKNKRNIKNLEVRLEVAQSGFRTMKSALQMDLERLKSSVNLLESETTRKAEYFEEKQPVVKRLYEELDEHGKEYSELKNEVVAIRNQEKSVNEQIKRAKTQIEKLSQPMEKFKEEMKEVRAQDLQQLSSHAEERKALEADIYHTAAKLEQVTNSRNKFDGACAELQEDIDTLQADMESHSHHQHRLCDKLVELEEEFSQAWEVCINMEKKSADQDQEILDGIAEVQKETRERSVVLNGIATSLREELHSLTGFVDNVSSRRPKDTRQSTRKSLTAGVDPASSRPPTQRRPTARRISRPPISALQVNELNSPLAPEAASRRRSSGKAKLLAARPVIAAVGTA